ncbi:hypothetical protein SeLEV6574_g04211 [Synchytrium endobioticum]|uniref:Tubulin/FtsZ GTPase domain-containing protein n=1 Tax=Synchytrium endobioticum TaxID=286115 RepID=A0A507D0D2_9FUNG|nr:hypothetical protein SeLEV6574_g04211 [Synchytrium endobioticum]
MGFMIETIKIMGMYYMRWYNLKKDSCDVECGEQSLPIACIGTLTSLFSGCLPGPIVWLIRWLSIPWSVIVAFYVIKFAWWLVLYVVPWTRPRAIRKVTDYVDARMPKNATIRTQWDGIKRRYLARRRDGAPDLRDEVRRDERMADDDGTGGVRARMARDGRASASAGSKSVRVSLTTLHQSTAPVFAAAAPLTAPARYQDTPQHFPITSFKQIVIDTERKTWRKRRRHAHASFPLHFIDNGTCGRGNNWAHGYFGDAARLAGIVDMYRHVAETSHRYDGCMLLHSVAGGTGSGLGSRLAEEIRDMFPKGFLLSAAVIPFQSGETTLQSYNTLLTLGWLQRNVDTVALFSNDAVMGCIQRQLGIYGGRATTSGSRVSLEDLNEYISNCLAGFLLPTSEQRGGRVSPTHIDPWSLITHVTPMPCCKMTSFSSSVVARQASKNAVVEGWDDLAATVTRNAALPSAGHKRWTLSTALVARGTCSESIPRLETRIAARMNTAALTLHRTSHYYATDARSRKTSLTLCYNSNDVVPLLESVVRKAGAMYKEKAFVHWYAKHGGARVHDVFEECFEETQSVVDAYNDFALMR